MTKIHTFEQVSKNKEVASKYITSPFEEKHVHTFWEFMVVERGAIDSVVNDKTYHLTQGDCLFVKQGDVHTLLNNRNCRFINVCAKDDYFRSALNVLGSDVNACELNVRTFTLPMTTVSVFVNRTVHSRPPFQSREEYERQCKIIFFNLLSDLFAAGEYGVDTPSYFVPLIAELQNPFSTVSPGELSKLTGYSYSRLSRLFKSHYGITMNDYRRNVRLVQGAEMLLHTDMTVSVISEMLNYQSMSHFYRDFKRKYGVTPMQYKKKG